MLDGFCLLSKKKKKSHPLFVTDKYQDAQNTNKKFLHCLSSFKDTSCITQLLDLLFIVVFIIFYINIYHFLQFFRTSFKIIWKKDFRHRFSFFNRFNQTPHLHPHPINSQNPLSVTKVFLSILPNLLFFKVIMR